MVISVIVLAIALGAVAYFYAREQGMFDPPLVRFARVVTENERVSVSFARKMSADKTEAWADPEFAANAGWQFEPSEITREVAVLHFIANRSPDLLQIASFDWKEGPDEVAPAFLGMMEHFGVSGPSPEEMKQFEQESLDKFGEFTAIPVLVARYDPYFRRAGYVLMHVNINSDSYFLVLMPTQTAKCWNGVRLHTSGEKVHYDAPVFFEEAIAQSGDFIKAHAPEMIPLLEAAEKTPAREAPSSACLPVNVILKRVAIN